MLGELSAGQVQTGLYPEEVKRPLPWQVATVQVDNTRPNSRGLHAGTSCHPGNGNEYGAYLPDLPAVGDPVTGLSRLGHHPGPAHGRGDSLPVHMPNDCKGFAK
jgi:hypothetical protein